MANQTTQSFGINSGSGGGGGGGTVTSVAMTVPSALSVGGSPITGAGTLAVTGAGTTAQYIDGTGALQTTGSTNGLITSFNGDDAPLSTAANGNVNMYDVSTFPPTTYTVNQLGRSTINLQTAGATARIGVGGVSTYDLISFTATITTTCASGILAISPATNGIFGGKISSPPLITCDGSTQSQIFTFSDFRVGTTTLFPTTPSTDFISFTYITTAPSANIRYTNLELSITQYSAT